MPIYTLFMMFIFALNCKADSIFLHNDPNTVKKSLQLDSRSKKVSLYVPEEKIALRIKLKERDKTIDPYFLYFKNNLVFLKKLCQKIALFAHKDELFLNLSRYLNPKEKEDKVIKVEITKEMLEGIDLSKLSLQSPSLHLNVQIPTTQPFLKEKKDIFFSQIKPFLSFEQIRVLNQKILSGSFIDIDQDLLPEFAKNRVRQYSIYRGPNCFTTALAFHNPIFFRSPFFNVKKEAAHHRVMINYDELHRTILEYFYPVNPKVAEITYGDLLLFVSFDAKQKLPEFFSQMDYRHIQHAAIYLFNDYTFQKGSKYAASPYTVSTFKAEWQKWRNIKEDLYFLVFRKKKDVVQSKFAPNLIDWIY